MTVLHKRASWGLPTVPLLEDHLAERFSQTIGVSPTVYRNPRE
ncbi:MAG: hypothetical protein ACYTGH_10045 [Planctomycetota bacterium]